MQASIAFGVIGVLAVLIGAPSVAAAGQGTAVSRAPVVAFLPAGDVGGGVLVPGTLFPPAKRGRATLKRGEDWIQVNIKTSGLPPGAYTVWWVIFNNPAGCSTPCGLDDVLNPAAAVSVFWATGKVVKENGIANFHDRYTIGDDLGFPGTQHSLGGEGDFLDPQTAEIHNIIKYHGPASDDPDVLYDQTHTLLGSCFVNANAHDFGPPFGVQCFDPQAVAHLP
jgi:hypothetical protein